MNEKKTFGKRVKEHLEKTDFFSVYDVRDDVVEDTRKKLNNTIEQGKKKYPGDFYLVIEQKVEILLDYVARSFIFHRLSCPTPHYDQTAFKYHKKDDRIEFLWSIPRKTTVARIFQYPIGEDPTLVKTVFDFTDGTFYKKCLELNWELEGKRDNYRHFDDQLVKEIYG